MGDASHLCDRAARAAAHAQNVPLDVLRAISRAETGRGSESGLHPWPWTVNMEGAGKWFNSEDEARAYVFKHFKRGARSFDVGCFQINYKWHGAAFRSIDDMFDPMMNADYAASFLRDLYEEFNDWSAAAGAYHSRTPTYARSYAARFDQIRGSMSDVVQFANRRSDAGNGTNSGSGTGILASRRSAPLLGGGATRLGSLVPVSRDGSPARTAFVLLN
ncbi:transglycosylase SLT domain-containing protein [Rhodobacteraceae bacterium F11138]|nr:transglycosylase SLT domain-containing protein [Rhodobacteraceae bacterium F11138]